MKDVKLFGTGNPGDEREKNGSPLDEIVRNGAQKLLEAALKEEVKEFCRRHEEKRDEAGHRLVVKNGKRKRRILVTGAGALEIEPPRVDDRVLEGTEEPRFQSSLIPPYLRRTQRLEELVPFLYLKGISTGDFTEVLEKLTGEKVLGFSAESVVRMKQIWEQDYKGWINRDASTSEYVYWWVDGIYFNVRLDDERQCILVIIGAKGDGSKDLVAVEDGFRESKESWQSVLRDLKRRGLKKGPKLAVGDGALGFWAAVEEEFPDTKTQLCWVHKTANALDKLPKSLQGKGKQMIHNIYLAPTKEKGESAFDAFVREFELKYPKAAETINRNRASLLTFYDFPAEHWQSIRSTNVIESTFATVRLRTKRTKGCGSRIATLTMVYKLAESAQKRWRKLRGHLKLTAVWEGVRFKDGVELEMAA
jgi:putative transposase